MLYSNSRDEDHINEHILRILDETRNLYLIHPFVAVPHKLQSEKLK